MRASVVLSILISPCVLSPAFAQGELGDLSASRYLAEVLIAQGKLKQAEALLQEILAREEGSLVAPSLGLAFTLNDLANIYRVSGRVRLSESTWRRSLAIAEEVLGPYHPDVAVVLSSLADLKSFQGKSREAEALLLRARAILEQTAPPDPKLGMTLCFLATTYADQRQFERSTATFGQALALLEKAMGPEHTQVAICLNRRGRALTAQRRYVQAEADFRRTWIITEKYLGPEHVSTLRNLQDYAGLLRRMKRHNEAASVEQRVQEGLERNGFSRHSVDWQELTWR
jgi:tetratricopeptide (TPR) repeat protein